MPVFPKFLVVDLKKEISELQDKFPMSQRDLYEVTAQVMDDVLNTDSPALTRPLQLKTKTVPDVRAHFELGATLGEERQLQEAFADYRQGVVTRLLDLGIAQQFEHDGEMYYGMVSMREHRVVLRYLK